MNISSPLFISLKVYYFCFFRRFLSFFFFFLYILLFSFFLNQFSILLPLFSLFPPLYHSIFLIFSLSEFLSLQLPLYGFLCDPAPVNVTENNYQIEDVILLIVSFISLLSHYFDLNLLFYGVSVSVPLSVCTLTHTLCLFFTPTLSISTFPLSSSLSLSLYLSSFLHCCPSTIQLIFYYLFILFCWLYFILPSIILFILLSACL